MLVLVLTVIIQSGTRRVLLGSKACVVLGDKKCGVLEDKACIVSEDQARG